MILITGSKGFVGKNLMERLKPNYKIWEFNRGDLLNLENIGTVIHLACNADSRNSNRSIEKSVEDNTGIFAKVLEEATNRNVRRFIYVSSIEAETEHNVYAICKATNEKILKVVAKEYGIEYVIIRPCNLYGPYMDLSDTNRNVVANFMRSIKEGKPMNVIGNKSYPFTYVKSLIDRGVVDSICGTNDYRRIRSLHLNPTTCESFRGGYNYVGLGEKRMKVVTLEGVSESITIKVGKKQGFRILLVPVISQALNMSKSKAKRLIDDGAIDITFNVQEIV
jgi:dTDP-D-glucose 4,6-dehydratase